MEVELIDAGLTWPESTTEADKIEVMRRLEGIRVFGGRRRFHQWEVLVVNFLGPEEHDCKDPENCIGIPVPVTMFKAWTKRTLKRRLKELLSRLASDKLSDLYRERSEGLGG